MLNQLLKKIIKTRIGTGRFAMAGIGLTIAILLILSAVQIQSNYNELLYGKSNQDSIANFLVVNKVVSGNRRENNLTPAEIEDLKKQPFVDKVGLLTASRFRVSAQSPSDKLPFYSEIFFESVPDEFIDVQSKDWTWQPGSTTIPVIIPNQFLDLYNFGFAPSQNLPQLTQSMVMALPVVINVNYMGSNIKLTGKVVGFSDRISSVLVPQNFLDFANKHFAAQSEVKPSRIVIRTKDPGNPQLVNYLKVHELVTDADKTRFSKYRSIVNTVVNVSWLTGAVMLLFALLVFSLFIQLTIASTRHEINLLVTIGASPRQLQRFLIRQFLPSNIIITLCCLGIVAALQYFLQQFLEKQNMVVNPVISSYTIGAALVIIIVLWLVNFGTIRKYVRQSSE